MLDYKRRSQDWEPPGGYRATAVRPAHPLATMQQQTRHHMIIGIRYSRRRVDTNVILAWPWVASRGEPRTLGKQQHGRRCDIVGAPYGEMPHLRPGRALLGTDILFPVRPFFVAAQALRMLTWMAQRQPCSAHRPDRQIGRILQAMTAKEQLIDLVEHLDEFEAADALNLLAARYGETAESRASTARVRWHGSQRSWRSQAPC